MPKMVIPLRENTGNDNDTAKMVSSMRLYHYEKIQGTTTNKFCRRVSYLLYHYEKIQGTTTFLPAAHLRPVLYHYEKIQGTAVNCYLYLQFN